MTTKALTISLFAAVLAVALMLWMTIGMMESVRALHLQRPGG
jgi:hypothetical protein